jgi:hypothetical protein
MSDNLREKELGFQELAREDAVVEKRDYELATLPRDETISWRRAASRMPLWAGRRLMWVVTATAPGFP